MVSPKLQTTHVLTHPENCFVLAWNLLGQMSDNCYSNFRRGSHFMMLTGLEFCRGERRRWLAECWWLTPPSSTFPVLRCWVPCRGGEPCLEMSLLWTVKLWWSNISCLEAISPTPTLWLAVDPDLDHSESRSLTRMDPWSLWGLTGTGPSSWPCLTPLTSCPCPGCPSGHTVSSPALLILPFQDISTFLRPQDSSESNLRLVKTR